MNRENMNWNKKITDEEIYISNSTPVFMLLTNTHIPLIAELKEAFIANYKVEAEFIYMGYNGDSIYCNSQRLVYRKNKFSDFTLGKDVKYINGNLSRNGGGSNAYPRVSFEGAKCTLEFISYGLPEINKLMGWKINIIKLEKI
jgi:hypothetical protein